MGNTTGSLRLMLEKPQYAAGETMTGAVDLHLLKSIEGKELVVEYVCTERVKWEESDDNGSHSCHSDQVLHRQSVLVVSITDALSPGDYSYPFAFNLDADVPPSFGTVGGSLEAYVKHQIVARISATGLFGRLKATADFKLVVPPQQPSQLFEEIQRSMTNKVSMLGVNQGECKVTVSLGKNVFMPGETIDLYVSVDNRSKSTSCKVVVRFLQILRITPRKHEKGDKTKFVQRTIATVGAFTRLDENVQLPLVSECKGWQIQSSLQSKRSLTTHAVEVACEFSFLRRHRLEIPVTLIPSSAVATAIPAADVDTTVIVMGVPDFEK